MQPKDPKEGEIWTYRSARKQSDQTSIIVSIPALRTIPYRIAVPVVQWMKDNLEYAWMVLIQPNQMNGLTAIGAADAKLCCSYPVQHFVNRVGSISGDQLQEIREAIALCIGLASESGRG